MTNDTYLKILCVYKNFRSVIKFLLQKILSPYKWSLYNKRCYKCSIFYNYIFDKFACTRSYAINTFCISAIG